MGINLFWKNWGVRKKHNGSYQVVKLISTFIHAQWHCLILLLFFKRRKVQWYQKKKSFNISWSSLIYFVPIIKVKVIRWCYLSPFCLSYLIFLFFLCAFLESLFSCWLGQGKKWTMRGSGPSHLDGLQAWPMHACICGVWSKFLGCWATERPEQEFTVLKLSHAN